MTSEKIGLALGSGAARGWAHIGVLRELEKRGLHFDVVCGSSIGALVGAAYASEQLDVLETWVRGLERMHVLRLLDTSLRSGGLFLGARVFTAIRERLEDVQIEKLPRAFAAVATNLYTGQEVWLRDGSMLDAARASSGIPGLLAPVCVQGKWLVDGGVVNPVPVSLCRALGADRVIAINLNGHLGRSAPPASLERLQLTTDTDAMDDEEHERETKQSNRAGRILTGLTGFAASLLPEKRSGPSLFDVIGSSLSIMQDRITRSRMIGDPPDLVIEPRVGHLELLDFHKADEAIEAGRASVAGKQFELERLVAAPA